MEGLVEAMITSDQIISGVRSVGRIQLLDALVRTGVAEVQESATSVSELLDIYRRRSRRRRLEPAVREAVQGVINALEECGLKSVSMVHVTANSGVDGIVLFDGGRGIAICAIPGTEDLD